MRKCETCYLDKDDSEFYGGRKHCKKCNRDKYAEKVKNKFYEKDETKKCSICEIYKESSEFRTHRTYCKKCGDKKTYESRKGSEKVKEASKRYQKNNRDKINKRIRAYKKNRSENDILYKCSVILSRLVNNSVRLYGFEKKSRSIDIIGLSKSDFRLYLESKFEPWMSWENYGKYNGDPNYGWDIDHIIPLSSAESEEDLIRLNYYTNLQPLCSFINRCVKRDK